MDRSPPKIFQSFRKVSGAGKVVQTIDQLVVGQTGVLTENAPEHCLVDGGPVEAR